MDYTVDGVAKSRTQLSNSHFHFHKFHSGKGYKTDKIVTLEIIHKLRTPWAPKSLQMVIAAMKLKDAYSLEGKL